MELANIIPHLHRPAHAALPAHWDGTCDDQGQALRVILDQRALSAVFQPILDLNGNGFIGFEGLIRGPADSPLHAPSELFAAAQRHGVSLELEMLCRQVVLESFARQELPGRLFLNISPTVLAHPSFRNGQTLEYMRRLGITPDQVTIEITENEATVDIEAMREALLHYREMGFKIALDDLGEGFSSLRLWSELRPEFVKIDKHFVKGADSNPLKQQFLKSFQHIAASCNSQIIAEGIETEAEFMLVKNSGIAFGQGYYIARPVAVPASVAPSDGIATRLAQPAPRKYQDGSRHRTAQHLLVHVEPVSPETENNEILARFVADPALNSIPVVQHGKPVCLINRHSFMDRFAQPFQRELLGNKPCLRTMHGQPLLVEKNTSIQEVSQFLTESQHANVTDGFIVVDGERYLGVGTWQDLLRAITQMQIEAAHHANPLTLLPGNVPINEQINLLLEAGEVFHACYCDLDHFKPFNDVYGYCKGDEMIQLTGRILRGACDPALDFIGHIGGDDFILLMRSHDWKKRCDEALQAFALASVSLVSDEHRLNHGYSSEDRQGLRVFHPLPSLSIGAVQVEPSRFSSHHEVAEAATAAKKMAKGMSGNSLFLDCRKHSRSLDHAAQIREFTPL